ncbi:MAG TPA: cupin domain-containing protein [Actinomycetes bacterium]|jgi:quercetin dioxygenase-like cupin family protein|nr:cupin domain-containing protein [Actinomycetes bacterium]
MEEYFLDQTHGEVANLGMLSMRLLVSKAQTNGAFAVAEFRGSQGSWTVPHIHRSLEESFYVLEGTFAFTLGDRDVEAKQGAFVLVPRGTPHIMRAGPGGGALLTLWVPGGLEEMFLELGRLPAESITDRAVRAEVAKRYDSVPI